MKIGMNGDALVAFDEGDEEWVRIGKPWGEDLLAFLGDGERAVERARELLAAEDRLTGSAPSGLPFRPGSLRAFALWEKHMVGGAHGMIERFGTPVERNAVQIYEKLTRKTFPALRMPANYFRYPQYYMSNHRSVLPDRAEVPWPRHAEVVDFELEVGIIVGREVRNCTPAEGLAAIAGFTVMNDLSLRDTQWSDTRQGTFGGVVKSKTWAGAMGSTVVTPEEILPHWNRLTGSVRVNGDLWVRGSTAGSQWGPGDAIAYASRDETLYPGDVLSSGTLPGCCGLELRRFPKPGDRLDLEIEGIGTLTTFLGQKEKAR